MSSRLLGTFGQLVCCLVIAENGAGPLGKAAMHCARGPATCCLGGSKSERLTFLAGAQRWRGAPHNLHIVSALSLSALQCGPAVPQLRAQAPEACKGHQGAALAVAALRAAAEHPPLDLVAPTGLEREAVSIMMTYCLWMVLFHSLVNGALSLDRVILASYHQSASRISPVCLALPALACPLPAPVLCYCS